MSVTSPSSIRMIMNRFVRLWIGHFNRGKTLWSITGSSARTEASAGSVREDGDMAPPSRFI